MLKDFDEWNKFKKNLDKRIVKFFFKEREVRWCNLGFNIGKEIDGKGILYARPVLILKKLNKHTCFIVPFTKSKIFNENLRHLILNDQIQKINLGQIRVISSKRLNNFIGLIDSNVFNLIKNDIRELYFI